MSILKTATYILAAAILTLAVDASASAAGAAASLGYGATPPLPYGDVVTVYEGSFSRRRKPPERIYKPAPRSRKAHQ